MVEPIKTPNQMRARMRFLTNVNRQTSVMRIPYQFACVWSSTLWTVSPSKWDHFRARAARGWGQRQPAVLTPRLTHCRSRLPTRPFPPPPSFERETPPGITPITGYGSSRPVRSRIGLNRLHRTWDQTPTPRRMAQYHGQDKDSLSRRSDHLRQSICEWRSCAIPTRDNGDVRRRFR